MLLRHTLSYALGRGLPALVNVVTVMVYTRLLAPEVYGQYALMITSVALGNAILFQWLRLSLLRFLPAQGEQPERLLATLFGGYLAVAAVVVLLGGLGVRLLLDTGLRLLGALGVGLLVIQAWYELNLNLARSRLAPGRYGAMFATKAVTAPLVGVALIVLAGLAAAGPLIGLAVAMLATSLGLMGRAWRGIRPRLGERALIGELLRYGLPLTATFALSFVVASSDRFLIAWLIGTDAAGIYAAGYDLGWAAITSLAMIVNLAGYPLVVRTLERDGRAAADEQVRQNMVLLLTLIVPMTVGVALCAPSLAAVILGPAFRADGTELLPVVAVAALLGNLKLYYVDLSFQLGRRTLQQVWVMVATAAVNLILNLLWIPSLGLLGAAYATAVAYALGLGLGWLLSRRVFPLPFPWRDGMKIVLASLGMAAVILSLTGQHGPGPGTLLMQLSAGAATYACLLLLLNVSGARGFIAEAVGRKLRPAWSVATRAWR